jgi:1-deoxy-D-xylulose-5-phosphate synthase
VTMAAGLAKEGFRPVVAVYSTFLQRAYDQIIHDICLQNLPVLLMLDRAGLVGSDGPTHHGVFDLSFLRQIPNLTVMAPKDGGEFRDMIATALKWNGPAAIRYPRRAAADSGEKRAYYQILAPGKGEVLREGREVALIAVGAMVENAVEASHRLFESGIDCTVVNARFVKPLDEELLLQLAKNHKTLITVEENILAGGFGSAVLEFLNQKQLSGVKLTMLGIPDQFIPHGDTETLLQQCGLDVESICRTVLECHGMGLKRVHRIVRAAK